MCVCVCVCVCVQTSPVPWVQSVRVSFPGDASLKPAVSAKFPLRVKRCAAGSLAGSTLAATVEVQLVSSCTLQHFTRAHEIRFDDEQRGDSDAVWELQTTTLDYPQSAAVPQPAAAEAAATEPESEEHKHAAAPLGEGEAGGEHRAGGDGPSAKVPRLA